MQFSQAGPDGQGKIKRKATAYVRKVRNEEYVVCALPRDGEWAPATYS